MTLGGCFVMEENIFDLKKFRESLGLSQRELAEKIGVTQSTLNSWEKNPGAISFITVNQIATKLGFKLEDMLNYEDKIIGKNNFSFDDKSIADRKNANKTIFDFKNSLNKLGDFKNLEDLKAQLEVISNFSLIQNRKLNLALFGKSDSGKSTMINSLIGEEVSPTQWSAATRSVIKFVGIEDKPSSIGENDTIVVATSLDENSVTIEQLEDIKFLDAHLCSQGDRSLITRYGIHNKELELEENLIYTIFSFIDSEILKGINIIDTPGISTGNHKKGNSDTNASENTILDADLIVYTSPINQFLQNEDQIYLKRILDSLDNKIDKLLNNPFSNLWIVATQAQIIDNALDELQKEDGIFDKAVENFINTLPKDYFSNKGPEYSKSEFRKRFFSFSRDSKALTKDYKEDFIFIISSYLKEVSNESIENLKVNINEIRKNNNEKIVEFENKGNDINSVKEELKNKKNLRPEEFRNIDSVFKDIDGRTDYYSLKSQKEFTDAYNEIFSIDYIKQLIDDRNFKNNKKDKEKLYTLINNIISEKINEITKKYANEFSTELEDKIQKFSPKIKTFDFKRSFISLLSGGIASGALIAYMGTLGNLGGYILVTQAVGVLSSLGISVGGGAAATTFVSTIGGPVTIAIGLGVLLTMSVFAVSGIGWKSALAKKIIKEYNKENALEQYINSIEEFWKETKNSLNINKKAMKKAYDLEIIELEKEANQNAEYFFKQATDLKEINKNLDNYFI